MAANIKEEDDYMSPAFIEGINNITPVMKVKPVQKKLRVIEKELREEGLNQEIGSHNKGFQLLQKMGYKPEVGLGKKGQGLKAPIPLNVKSDRSGLGRKEELERTQLARWQNVQKLTKKSTQDFRNRKRNEASERQIKKDLHHSRKVCEQLDAANDISEPLEKWFWPEALKRHHESDSDNEEEEEEEQETQDMEEAEQLKMLTNYLRSNYFYCIWCGIKYDDSEDLMTNCPGNDFDCHQ